ncbi:hypothetical protein GQ457_05G028120 [Hibiscus cannabinus]
MNFVMKMVLTKNFLTICYLRVLLVTRKLTEKDCQPLLDKIKLKLGQWSRRLLSYYGRIQLIKSFLFGLRKDLPVTGAKGSWETICTLESEGRLGLKNIQSSNDACVLHLIKSILEAEGSLWVAWTHAYVLKGNDFWQAT